MAEPTTCEEFADIVVSMIPNVTEETRADIRRDLLKTMNLDELKFLATQMEPQAKMFAHAISLIKHYGRGTFRALFKGSVQWTRRLRRGECASDHSGHFLFWNTIEQLIVAGLADVIERAKDGTPRAVRLKSGDITCVD